MKNFGKLFICRVRLPRAFYSRKTCFLGWLKNVFFANNFLLVDLRESGQSKVCRAYDARNFGTKFIGSKYFNPGKARSEKWPATDPPNFRLGCSIFGWADWVDFDVIRSGIVQLDFLPYEIFWSRLPWPATARQTQKWSFLGSFWFFRQLKSMQMGKSILKRKHFF